jgi:hypothetical protein
METRMLSSNCRSVHIARRQGLVREEYQIGKYECQSNVQSQNEIKKTTISLQTAEEEVGSALASQMLAEPYFVDFLRDAPEATGKQHP